MHVFYQFIILTYTVFGQSVEEIDYYENLIKNKIEEAKHYKLLTNNSEYIPLCSDQKDIEDYDFVVIGSGTAGSVVANRLSEMAQYKILLLEAGTSSNNFTNIPGMSFVVWNSKYNWGYKTVPQTTCCQATRTKSVNLYRGKEFGGTTIFNGLRYVRGSKYDFDYWVKMGNQGWSYREVLPYFKKVENTSVIDVDNGYHGHSGPIHVENYKSSIPHVEVLLNAHKELGLEVLDYNGKEQLGVSRSQLMSKNGRRIGAGTGYIDPIRTRPNIKIMENAFVTKILIDSKKNAYGVLFSKNGKLIRVKARKEIILSAGATNSPQILMLSGIGPAEDLKKLGIEVIQDLQVGKNMIDHGSYDSISFNTNTAEYGKSIREYVTEYLNRDGPYTIAIGMQALGFYKTKYAEASYGADVIFDFIPPFPIISSSKETSAYTPENFDALNEDVRGNTNVQIGIMAAHPKSRGSVKLKSNSPFDFPEIDINILSDKKNEDRDVIKEGIKFIMKLAKTKAMKQLNATLARVELPACKQFEYLSEDYWNCHIIQLSDGGYHIMSTCPMGPSPSTGAVVNSKLKVHGVKNLRVVDSSVIIRTSGFPAAVTMMIAEKISDEIKKEYMTTTAHTEHGIAYIPELIKALWL